MKETIEVRQVVTDADFADFLNVGGTSHETVNIILSRGADSHWMAVRGAQIEARCSLWWSSTPPYAGHKTGAIGHFAAANDAAAKLLDSACGELARHKCTIAIGPMDGNTWRRYRALTDRGQYPPFFLEPDNPDNWRAHFTSAGFSPLAEYYSARTTELVVDNPRVEAVWDRLKDRGFSIRTLNPSRLDQELDSLYQLALASFAGNFLYTPITHDEFLAQYKAIMPLVQPEIVLLAEHERQAVGFVFAIPDVLEQRRGEAQTTFIVKTLAVHPDFGGLGLGSLLLWQVNRAARKLGYRAAIHALMHQDNQSMRISAREGQIFRQYTLYARTLGASL